MNANQLIEVDPYLVAFSLNNPRRRRGLDIDSLNALASSIKAHGLAQPILVRPLPGDRAQDTFAQREDGHPLPTFELVCGERRLRASRLAELDAIPMLVRDLDDQAALELQLVENIEREDLDPMEEAEGFELLRTKLGYSIEQIAERIGRGKGTSYVYKTMKLLALTPESREAMYEGHLGRSTGLLVARYPAGMQAQVVEYIRSIATKGDPAPYRVVSPQVFRRFNLELGRAVWSIADASLVPAAGACTACPKRTGAHADLFGDDADSPDSCTDPDCFEGKRGAHIERVKADAAKAGFKVIDGEEAKTAIPSPYSHYIHGYSAITDVAYHTTGDDGVEREVTFEDALRAQGKKAPKPRILINPHTGAAVKVITSELAEKLQPLQDQDQKEERAGFTRRPQREDTRPEDEKALDDYHLRRAVTLRLFDAIRNRARTDADMQLIARAFFALTFDNGLPALENYKSWNDLADSDSPSELMQQKLLAMPPAELAATLIMAAVEVAMTEHTFTRQDEVALAAQYGVDVLALRDKVADDLERQDDSDEDDDPNDDNADEPEEPPAGVGARVQMKQALRGHGGKFRKISGRSGTLTKALPLDDWMVTCDGSKEAARVQRSEFVVTAAASEQETPAATDDADSTPVIDPNAAWPFPVSKSKARKAPAGEPA